MAETHYANPVWPGYMADPFVLRSGGVYYAFGTAPRDERNGRHFRLLRSEDLAHWENLGGALTPLDGPGLTHYWAPEVAERDGTFYMYYSAGGPSGDGHRLRVATADRPEGPFTDTGRLILPDEPFSIDASPFRDPQDGRWYLFFAKDFLDGDRPGTGTAVIPLADDMVSLAGKMRTVVRASADWQIFERDRPWLGRAWEKWHTVEGPFCVFHEGLYYCLYSGSLWNGPDYGVGYGVAEHPLGPWRDASADGPSVLRGIPGEVLGPGHNSVVLGPDGRTEYVVYHAWDPEMTARRMCIDPLVWTPDGPCCAGPTSTVQAVR